MEIMKTKNIIRLGIGTAWVCILLSIFFWELKRTQRNLIVDWCASKKGIPSMRIGKSYIGSSQIDCMSGDYVIEAESASKGMRAVKRVMHHSKVLDKKPAVLLIASKNNDHKAIEKIRKMETVKVFVLIKR